MKSYVNDLVIQARVPDRTQRRASKTRSRLLKAALSVFAEVGADAATIEMITQHADVGKGTFYLHFADKSDIVDSLVEQSVGDLVGAISQAAGRPQSLREALDGLCEGHVQFLLNRQQECVLLFQGRTLWTSGRHWTAEAEQPCARYLHCIGELVGPFLPDPVDAAKIRRLAGAMAGFASGFLAFAMITLEPQIVLGSIERVRGGFLDYVIGMIE